MYYIKNESGITRYATSACHMAMGYYASVKKNEGYAELWIEGVPVLLTDGRKKYKSVMTEKGIKYLIAE